MFTKTNHTSSANGFENQPAGGTRDRLVGQKMNDQNGKTNSEPASNMKGSLGDLGADLLSLSELQMELMTVDARAATREAVYPTLVLCVAMGFIIGACPVMLLGLSWWLSDLTQLSLAAACLIVATTALGMAAGLLWFACKGFKKSFELLKRSRTELQSNIQWIKKILSAKQRYRQTLG